MRNIISILFLFSLAIIACEAMANDAYVNPYMKKDGTMVQGHYRSSQDNNPYNNYSTQGNTNPYTGQMGTVNPYNQSQPSLNTPSYPSSRRSGY